MRGVPVGNIVNVALRSSCRNEIAKTNGHVYHSIFEVQMLLELDILRKDISHLDSVLII